MIKALFFLVGLGVSAVAEGVELTAEEWKEALLAKHWELGGYVASYEMVGENNRMDVKLAVDFESQTAVVELVKDREGEKTVVRQWTQGRDVIFMEVDGELLKYSGFVGMRKHVEDVLEVFPFSGLEGKVDWNPVPMVLLDAENVSATMSLFSKEGAVWSGSLEDAEVSSVDEKSVMFVTEEHGQVTICREHGVLLRQEVKGKAGEALVLKLLELEVNPGALAVTLLSADWEVAGATKHPAEALFGVLMVPKALMQLVVKAADEAGEDQPDVEDLKKDRTKIWKYVAPMVKEVRPIFQKAQLEPVMEQAEEKLREDFLERKGDPKDFKAYLVGEELRKMLRETLADRLVDIGRTEDVVEVLLFEGKADVVAKTERGKKVKEMLLRALVLGYCEEVLDRAMKQRWGE